MRGAPLPTSRLYYNPSRDDRGPPPLHLNDYWRVLRRRRGLAILFFLLIAAAGTARVVFVKPLYQATAQILIEREVPKVVDFGQGQRLYEMWEDFYQTQYRLLQSRMLARRVIERLDLLQDPEFSGPRSPAEVQEARAAAPGASPAMEQAIDRLVGRLRIQPLKNSQMVAIVARADRPELAARVANTLAEVYIQQSLDFRYRVSSEAGAWLADQNKEQAQKLEAAEKALQSFKEDQGLVNIEERRALLEQKLKDIGSALTVAKTRRLEKEALYRQMKSARSAEELPDVIRSPLIQGLRTELAGLERQRAQLAERYLDQHPQVVQLQQQIDDTRQKIALEASRIVRAAENDYRAAAAAEASVSGALEGAKAEALDLSRRGLKYDSLKRDLEASQRVSDNLVTRQKQTDVERDVKASNVHVIDAAVVPSTPLRPRPVRDSVLSLLLGLACAVAAAFVRDYMDTSVGKPADVRQLGQSLLGVIPETTRRGGRPLLANGRAQDPFAEGYRVLRTALDPADAMSESQVLLVTSTLPGEGKTLTSVNLALTLSSTDQRVLLVDADLRRPSLHAMLRTRRIPGLSEVLVAGLPLEQAIQQVPGTRLSLLPCGVQVECSPADLLSTGHFRELLASLRGRFDRVILDTPPVCAIADALILAPMADGVLVVARSGKVTRSALAHVVERLAQARARVLGVVLNRARPDRHAYDYGPFYAAGADVAARCR